MRVAPYAALKKELASHGSVPPGERPDELTPALYRELRRAAAAHLRHERHNHTLQPTALVNEAYLRLVAGGSPFADRTHFLAAAAHVMREILIDYARTRNRAKRGGGQALVSLEDVADPGNAADVDLLALDDALEALERIDPQQRQLVELRYFSGLTIEETAHVLGSSPATVKREWRAAKAWLHRQLAGHISHEP